MKSAEQGAEKVITAKSIALQTLTQQIQTAQRNLAFAASSDDFTAISGVLQQLRNQKSKLEQELNQLQSPQAAGTSVEDKVEAAIKLLAELPELAQDQGNFATLGELFQRLNVQLFLKFQPEQRGKRVLNQLVSGMITVGNAPSPITQYQGATSRQGLKEAAAEVCSAAVSSTADCVFVPKTKSLGNANRDDRI